MSKQNDIILIPSETDTDELDASSQHTKTPLASKTNVIPISETPRQDAHLGTFVHSVFTSAYSDSDDLLPSPRNALGITCESNPVSTRPPTLPFPSPPKKIPNTPSQPHDPIVLSSSPPSAISQPSPLFASAPPSNLQVIDNFQKENGTLELGSSPLHNKAVHSVALADSPRDKASCFKETILDASHNALPQPDSLEILSNSLDRSLLHEKNLLQFSSLSNRFADSGNASVHHSEADTNQVTRSPQQAHNDSSISFAEQTDVANGLVGSSGGSNVESTKPPSSSSKPNPLKNDQDEPLFELPSVESISTTISRKRALDASSATPDNRHNSTDSTQSNDLQKLKRLKKYYSRSFQSCVNDHDSREALHNTLRKSKTMGKVGLSKKKIDEAERKKNRELQRINKVKRTKEDCLSEMILILAHEDLFSLWGASLCESLKPFSCEFITAKDQLKSTVIWKRKVNTYFDHSSNRFEFVTEHIHNEPFSLYRIPCSDFVTKIVDNIVDDFVKSCKLQFPKSKLIFILEGVNSHFKNVKSDINRQYANAVNTGTKPLLFGSLSKYQTVTKEVLENEVCRMNVQHNVLLNYSNDEKETADWIKSFTSDIALSRYKQSSHLSARTSLAEIGHVKSADRVENTLNFMLRQILRVTPNISNAICDHFPSIPKLVQYLEANGEESLSNIMIATAVSERNLGTALSRRIYNTFLGRKSADDAP
ncbi:Holliday junction resolvase subunit Eme1 [Schizosaccharomyces cryophilus OY26]|uniref:Holliday junction resolvase subunit Eme1 n=1 Tax=Schizosaccharomyces cryophilus (strain OY26 / ATCC MYA-4695 / CBS 11777 / NBRC 106824 / NRRL Y48691) TaxID=653667 RepID=S9X4N5_SCHCR|nr:Holliday junction resolvase subunit Eme1 [Schizosaccharomyces cryophilus OY26]EPY52037.1 Holliday junction resolvase subunit Eme1 [Schizosaccharomyces cryophilus OY26]